MPMPVITTLRMPIILIVLFMLLYILNTPILTQIQYLMIRPLLFALLLAIPATCLLINTKQSSSGSDVKLSFLYLSEALHETTIQPNSITYYSLSLEEAVLNSDQALTISVISPQRTFLTMYITMVPQQTQITQSLLPTKNNTKIQCSDQNVLTCPLFNVPVNQTILIALHVRDPVEYILLADQTNIQKLEIDSLAHTAQLIDRFAEIYALDMKQIGGSSFQEVTVKVQYLPQNHATDFKIFTIRAGAIPHKQPNQFIQKQESYSLGAYSQILTLFDTSQSYYIVLTGQAGLSVTITVSQPSSQIELSSPLEYLYDTSLSQSVNQIKQFTYNTANDQNISQYGIYIQKIRGQGSISVSVCQFLYNFTGQLGFSEYVVIHQDILACSSPVISVKLSNITWQVGVRLILQPYEQQQDDQTLYYFEQRVQSLHQIATQCKTYQIQPFPDNTQQQHVIIRYFTTIPKDSFAFKSCKYDSNQKIQCTQLTIADGNYYMINNISQIAQVQVCLNKTKTNITNLYYGLIVGIYPSIKTIQLERQVLGFVNCNEVVLYQVNKIQRKYGNNTTLEVRVKLINGNIQFNQNCSDVINRKFCQDNDQAEAWHYSASYNLSQFDNNQLGDIKFGVTGTAQSIFSVIAYLDENYPDPDPTPDPQPTPPTPLEMIELLDGINNITVSAEPLLLLYSAHMYPYNITIPYSENLCIEQFQTLSSIDQTPICSSNSTFFKPGKFMADSFYLRVSTKTQEQNSTQLTVNITVPTIGMNDIQFVMLSCSKYCYTSVKVTYFDWNKDSVITLRGPGYMNSSGASNLTSLKFQSVPFVFTAILPKGGDLFIEIVDGGANLVSKTKKSFVLDYFTPLPILVPVSDIDISTILVNSFGRKFSAIWKLYSFNISQQSSIIYTYPDRSETLMYKSPAYASSSTPVSLSNSEQTHIPLECDSYVKSHACFYTVLLKNAEQGLDLLNDNGDIEINLSNQVHFTPLNLPMIDTSSFGVNFYDAVLLMESSDQTNNLQINQNLISIQPRSSCGTLEVGLISSTLIFGQNGDQTKLVQVYSTQPCSYNIAITSCPLPLTFTSTPLSFSLNSNSIYYTLYTPSSDADYFNIQLWMNISSYREEQNYSSLIISVYEVMDHFNCTSNKNILISTSIVTVGAVPIYSQASDQSNIRISLSSSQSNLFLIQVTAEKPALQTPPLTLLITQQQSITLIPNSQPHPVFPSAQPITYTYQSTDNMWQFCYMSIIGSDSVNTIGLSIADGSGSVLDRNIKMEDKQNCVSIAKRGTDGIIKYTITLTYSKMLKVDVLYIYTKQYVQSIQTNHPHTALYQPKSLLLSSPNSKYGHCYNYDIANIQNAINIVFYPTTSLPPTSPNTSIYIPGTKLKSLYNIKQITSSRTGNLIDYEVKVHLDQFEQDNIQVCFKYDNPFLTKIIDEFDNYRVMFNQQKQYKNITNQPNMTAMQIFKFIDLNVSTPALQEWLITEIIQCDGNIDGNMTLLGSPSLNDIIMGNIAQFQQVYSKYNVLAGLAALEGSDHYFVGIKYTGEQNISYSINTFKVGEKYLPQSKWNIGNSKITAFQSDDKKHLIVQLPLALSNQTNNHTSINYTVYVISRQNTTIYNTSSAHIRCPNLQQISVLMAKYNISTIYNTSLVNPNIAMFKINVDLLPGRRLTVIAKVVINQTNSSMPITYFYNQQDVDVETNNQDGGDGSSSGPHIGLILLMLAIAVLLVVLFRIIYRLVRRKMNANTVQFELSQQNNPPTTQPAQPQRQSVRDNTGYGQFVEEQVSV